MLYIEDLVKKYGKFTAVDHMTLRVPEGSLFGFVGPNGAGKTTTIRIICGLLPATGGKITIDGIESAPGNKLIKEKIGYVPDFFGVYENLKVKEYMDFFGSMYGMNSKDVTKISNDLLELVNLSEKKEVYVDTLSRGMKQRLCVARALIHNPKILILDEPSSGLDPRARIEMKELLKNLHSMGKTIIISSHILSELSEMCDSIGIMSKGSLVASGKIEDIIRDTSQKTSITMKISSDITQAVALLKEQSGLTVDSIKENEISFTYDASDEKVGMLLSYLVQNHIFITDFHRETGNLESLFMKLTTNSTK